MASNSYDYNYPYQQSSVQQYSAYQTAPSSSNLSQPARPYQPAPPVVATRSTDYTSYPAQSYSGQGSTYGGAQNNSWGGSYGETRDTTSPAAEVLRNMSNTTYAPSTTSASPPGFLATNATAASRYSGNPQQAQATHQLPPSQTTTSSYGQSQARPRSVNTTPTQGSASNRGLPSPATVAGYPPAVTVNQQVQRSAGPAQPTYAHSGEPSVNTTRSATNAQSTLNDYSHRQLPNLDASRGTGTVSASYTYIDTQATASTAPAAAITVSDAPNQNAITVDPMAVYDPWPEYQRKQEALRVQREAEDAARMEKERQEEESRLEKQREEEQKQKAEEAHLAQMIRSTHNERSATADTSLVDPADAARAISRSSMEAEIRALMAKMREFNSKDPALLTRILEEERRTKAPKPPTAQTKSSTHPAQVAEPVQTGGSQAANQREKAAAKPVPAAASTKPATPVVPQPVTKPRQPSVAPASSVTPRVGNTIWPPEKKAQLASAASIYLNGRNPNSPMEPDQILAMLDRNPSYIELCEQLEAMGLSLDRAAFAKNLLTLVPDANSASRQLKPTPAPIAVASQKTQIAPPAVMKRDIGTPAITRQSSLAAPSTFAGPSYSAFPDHGAAVFTPIPVAEMVPIKQELKAPANKEEAARKRTFDDLIDLTQVSDEDFERPLKKSNVSSAPSYGSGSPSTYEPGAFNEAPPPNFPVPIRETHQPVQELVPPPTYEFKNIAIVEPLDRRKALRRNNYNIKTIARDVLLACGRHPDTRQLNQHLEVLKTTLPAVTNDSDLSTLRWDVIDPGEPPPGYFKDGVQGLAEDAVDEAIDEEQPQQAAPIDGSSGPQKIQAPEPINPFKQKRRGRPPRHSFPQDMTTPSTPKQSPSTSMSASAPRAATAGVGYSVFRSATEYDADGKPLPKKRGRPVGWRKAIHGSAAVQARPSVNGHTGPCKFKPAQPSALQHVSTGDSHSAPIEIGSRSPSVANQVPRYQSFKCKWQNCQAELHNLETLRRHVQKVHQKFTDDEVLQCLWAGCGTQMANHDPVTNMTIERFEPKSFYSVGRWQSHLEETHFVPLSWQAGDGPSAGLSGT